MASLGQVIGALISQIGRGRAQGDLASAEVAELYRQHPLLSSFPIPRMKLDEVVVDLKVAFQAAPVAPGTCTEPVRSELLVRLKALVVGLPTTDPALQAYDPKELGRFKEYWTGTVSEQVLNGLGQLLPPGGTVSAASLALGAAAVIRGYLCAALLAPQAKVPAETAQKILIKEAPGIEKRLQDAIQELTSEVLAAHPGAPDQLEVLVTASELQAIPLDHLTSVKLTLQESDQSWTEIETPDGATRYKLVPA